MEWFGGIGIDRYKARHEAAWALKDSTGMTNPATSPPWFQPEEGSRGSFDYEGTDTTIGAFAGLKYRINDYLGCELAVRNFGMKSWDFTPGAYFPAGSPERSWGKLEVGAARGWSMEIALSLKL